MDVKPVGASLLEKQFFKVGLQFLLGNGLEEVNLGLLSVELVLVSRNFTDPDASKGLVKVLVLL